MRKNKVNINEKKTKEKKEKKEEQAQNTQRRTRIRINVIENNVNSGAERLLRDRNGDLFRRCFERYHQLIGNNNLPSWGGPSEYFHKKTLQLIKEKGIEKSFKNDLIFEYLYATLTAWGLHRQDGKALLKDFDEFKAEILRNRSALKYLEEYTLYNVNTNHNIVEQLGELFMNIKVNKSEKTRLVVNSKLLFHLLPDLVVPMDRKHTFKLFKINSSNEERENIYFQEIIKVSAQIAERNRNFIEEIIRTGREVSIAKVIDDVLVGLCYLI